MSWDVGEASEGLENELQPFHHFTYVTAHSPIFPSLYLRHSSFFNPSVASPTSQFILQPFRRFTCHSSFFNTSVASPTWQLILQTFRRFIYVTVHSSTLLLLHLRHSSFTNPSFASPTSQAVYLRHLASRAWCIFQNVPCALGFEVKYSKKISVEVLKYGFYDK